MRVLVVYGSLFGTTAKLARIIGAALEDDHVVTVASASRARDRLDVPTDLVIVGAPTQIRHLLSPSVRGFLGALRERGGQGRAAAAFDTRMAGPIERTGAASRAIAGRLERAGCRVVVPPESFGVAGLTGPLAAGEEERARAWAGTVAEAATAANPSSR